LNNEDMLTRVYTMVEQLSEAVKQLKIHMMVMWALMAVLVLVSFATLTTPVVTAAISWLYPLFQNR
jgi:hypothetical protein